MRQTEQGKKNQKARAHKAVRILNRAYFRGDHRQNVVDMLTDLRHLCDVKGIDFADAEDSSYQHYIAEIKGED